MARPKKKNIDWFKCKSTESDNQSVKRLRARYGWEGFGLYHHIRCTIAQAPDCRLEYTDSSIELLAYDAQVKPEFLRELMGFLIAETTALLYVEEGYLFSYEVDESFSFIMNHRKRNVSASNNSVSDSSKNRKNKNKLTDSRNPQQLSISASNNSITASNNGGFCEQKVHYSNSNRYSTGKEEKEKNKKEKEKQFSAPYHKPVPPLED